MKVTAVESIEMSDESFSNTNESISDFKFASNGRASLNEREKTDQIPDSGINIRGGTSELLKGTSVEKVSNSLSDIAHV